MAELDPISGGDNEPAGQIGYRSQHERFSSAWQQVMRNRDRTAPVVGFSQEVVALVPVGCPGADRGGGRDRGRGGR